MNEFLPKLGKRLREARKCHFPQDDLRAFSIRIDVSRATLQKMEKGDLSVGMGKYFSAAKVLGLQHAFNKLFHEERGLFDD
jgi:hypothetical protein